MFTFRPLTPYISKQSQISFNDLEKLAKSFLSETELNKVRKAYKFLEEKTAGLKRLSGQPFNEHCLQAAYTLANLHADTETICAALLHELPSISKISYEEISANFGLNVANLINRVIALTRIYFKPRMSEKQIEAIKKMVFVIAQDIRVVLIKIADRLDNLYHLDNFDKAKKQRLLEESLFLYCPILNILGVWQLLSKVEDLCFEKMYPQEFKKLSDKFSKDRSFREKLIKKVKKELSVQIKIQKIPVQIDGRIKHLYSIFRKLKEKQKDFNEIYDIFAFRIIPKTVNECYTLLGIIHSIWLPKIGRFKDYIARPKPNGYQSLHTTVFGPDKKLIEFQIRTEKMNEEAEFGIAAHWFYKSKKQKNKKEEQWMKDLIEIKKTTKSEKEIIKKISIDVFKERIFVFTPKGDIIDLPQDSIGLDLAYYIHEELGNKADHLLINDKKKPLTTVLKTGDLVEIKTKKTTKPQKEWLNLVYTHQAREAIRDWFKKQS